MQRFGPYRSAGIHLAAVSSDKHYKGLSSAAVLDAVKLGSSVDLLSKVSMKCSLKNKHEPVRGT